MKSDNFKEGDKVILVKNLNKDKYYYGGLLEDVPLGMSGTIQKINLDDKLKLILKNGTSWIVHPDEVILKTNLNDLKKDIPGVEKIDRNPVFELAENGDVFLVGGMVYSVGEEKVSGEEDFFAKKYDEGYLRRGLIELSDFETIELMFLNRVHSEVENIGRNYIENVKRKNGFLNEGLDIPQFIYKYVFPHLRDEGYEDRINELLSLSGGNEQGSKENESRKKMEEGEILLSKQNRENNLKAESKLSLDLEKTNDSVKNIANNVLIKVDEMVKEIGGEGYESGDNLLERILDGKEIGIVKGEVYDLVNCKNSRELEKYVQIEGEKYSLIKREVEKISIKKDKIDVGDRIRMNEKARLYYSRTIKGSEGEVIGIVGHGKEYLLVRFDKITGNRPKEVPIDFEVRKNCMDNLEENLIKIGSLENLEEKYLVELGKKIRIDALKENFSREKVVEILKDQDEELLKIKGKKKYHEKDFGFFDIGTGNYYAYLNVPSVGFHVVPEGKDNGYYLFRESVIGIEFFKSYGRFKYSNVVKQFSKKSFKIKGYFCLNKYMPINGTDIGDVVAKRLKTVKQMIHKGNSFDWYGDTYIRIKPEKIKKLNLEIKEINW